MNKSESHKVPPTEMLPGLGSTFALPKKNVGKATKTKKEKDSEADKDDEETTTVKKAQEGKPENVETNGVAAKGKTGRGKKAGKKDGVVENLNEAVVAKVVEPEIPVPDIEHEESAPVAESKGKKNLVAAETDTQEKRVRDRQASSKDGTEKPAKTSEEPLADDEIESSLPAVPVVETKEKRGRVRQAKTPVEVRVKETIEAQEAAPAKRGRGKKAAVSKADSEEEAVEEVTEARKKKVAVAKKLVEEEEKKSAVLEEAAPAEVIETIESPETVPAKKSRGKKAGKKDAVEEAVFCAEPEDAEKKEKGKKSHLSADSASQVASEVDIPDEMDGPSSSGGDVASYDDHVRQRQQTSRSNITIAKAFEEIDTMANGLNLTKAIVDTAKQIFRDVHTQLKGYSTHLIASGCLHVACRQEGHVVTFKQISAVSKIEVKEIGRVHKKILKALDTSVAIINISDFMPRFCLSLGLPINVQISASHIGRRAMELDIVPGRSPISVAAASIYMASNASEKKLTKKEISDVADLADVTIRQSYELMYPRAAELFPADFTLILNQLPQR